MRAILITIDSWRYDMIPRWFVDKWKPTIYENAYTYYAGTIPSLTSFYTGLPPQWHGVEDHHIFYKFPLTAKTIFEYLQEKQIQTAFVSDEWLMYQMQCVQGVQTFDRLTEMIDFLKKPNTFVAFHIFHVTHAPYQDEQIRDQLNSKRKKAWLDQEFLKKAKQAQEKGVHQALTVVDQILTETHCNAIVSSDHGEAFGEELLYGHDRMNIEPVLRIPLLVIDHKTVPRTIAQTVYQSTVFNIILQWYGIEAKRAILDKPQYRPPPMPKLDFDLPGGVKPES